MDDKVCASFDWRYAPQFTLSERSESKAQDDKVRSLRMTRCGSRWLRGRRRRCESLAATDLHSAYMF
jgi:hypothetical protein